MVRACLSPTFRRGCVIVLVVALLFPSLPAQARVQTPGAPTRYRQPVMAFQDGAAPTPPPAQWSGELLSSATDRTGKLFLPLVTNPLDSGESNASPLVRPAAAAPPTPSGVFAPYPLNPTLNTLREMTGAPPPNATFDLAGAETGNPPANADFSAAPYTSGESPANHDFAAGTLEGWSSTGSITIDSDAEHGAWARLASGGVLTTAPFTITTEAQQLWVEVGYLHATSTSYVEVYMLRGASFATETKLRTLSCKNCGWLTATFDLTPYAGEAIKFKFKRTAGEIGIDNIRPVVALPGYTISGTVGREIDANHQVYASLSNGGVLTSMPFTVTTDSQYTLLRLTGLGATSDWIQIHVLSGANYTISTQVALTSVNDGWSDMRLALSAWQGQSIRLKLTGSGGKIGVDDVGRQLVEMPGWTVSKDSRRVEDGQGGAYASTDGVLVSSPFTLAPDVQQVSVRHRLESGSGQSFYLSLLRGPGFGEEVGPLAGIATLTTTWQTATIGVGAYAGEVVRLKLRTYYNRVQFDDVGFGERLLPGWESINSAFGAIAAGEDAAGTYVTGITPGGSFSLRSAPFSPGLSGGSGYQGYATVAYDIGYGVASMIRVWWEDTATQQQYVLFQDGAYDPTGYRLRYYGLPNWLGPTGILRVTIGGGKLYGVGVNVLRQHESEPYAWEAGAGIDTVTGAVRTTQEDVRVAGAFPLPFVRTLHSQLDQPGILGRGWSHLYNARLAFSQSGDISVILGAEQAHFFRKQTGGTFTPEDSRVQAALAKNLDNSYTYTATSGLRYGFTDSGRLLTLTDANDSVLTLGYDAGGALVTVTGDAGALAFA
ncbi:MAG: RHS repeat protein, partial [Caldilineaceae bacterium]|nr:RHS repeat protein [Caldilineaceae bacterium]